MDFFRFGYQFSRNFRNSQPTFVRGEYINGIKKATWIERYWSPGEFKLEGPIHSLLHEQLPISAVISHTKSDVVMVVEDQEIVRGDDGETNVIITGRSYESALERRIAGSTYSPTNNDTFGLLVGDKGMGTSGSYAGLITTYIENHINIGNFPNAPESDLGDVSVWYTVSSPWGGAYMTIKTGELYKTLMELLSAENWSIRAVRPGPTHPQWEYPELALHNTCCFVVYEGADRSDTIVFSKQLGDLVDDEYFWSDRTKATAALVQSKWYEAFVGDDLFGEGVHAEQRVILLNASDLDNHLNAAPTGAAANNLIAQLKELGQRELDSRSAKAIIKTGVSPDVDRYKFRSDYYLGDIVKVLGDFGVSDKKRVIEHVEIQDENGFSSYPSLEEI